MRKCCIKIYNNIYIYIKKQIISFFTCPTNRLATTSTCGKILKVGWNIRIFSTPLVSPRGFFNTAVFFNTTGAEAGDSAGDSVVPNGAVVFHVGDAEFVVDVLDSITGSVGRLRGRRGRWNI